MRRGLFGLVLAVAVASAGAEPAAACDVTEPNGDTPPGEERGGHHHGNGRLWTVLPSGGQLVVPDVVRRGEAGLQPDGSIRTKFPWWGGRSARRRLRIKGRRLDGRAAPLRARIRRGYTEAPYFWATMLRFPTEGCWRVTGRSGRAKLRFVLSVSVAAGAQASRRTSLKNVLSSPLAFSSW
jgi:hypothetical protein